ncbi:hypothetical protein B6U98_00330 [Thermoplasmatales archaeon ex4572_165]|nr:MAG: hypothetical protein B6U98_00330 [Thermoplasmatales archaeon ex4572_165]
MKHKNNKILAIFAVALIGFIVFSTSSMADVTVDIIPVKPSPEETIEITAKITDENVTAVYVELQECNGNTGICYSQENITMTGMIGNEFTSSITLTHDDATYLQYTIIVQTDQGWAEYNKDTKVDYEISAPNNGNTDDDNNTPGFEFVSLALSIMFISLILYRRKR